MKKPIPHPFRAAEHIEGAAVLTDVPDQLAAAIAAHVLGHRITKVEFTRTLDEETSVQLGAPVDNIDLVLHLDNNVSYIARLVVSSFATVSRGEAMAHIPVGDPNYVTPK